MTRIYLIRHAEAEGNYYRRIQGRYDGKITIRGKLQLAALAERFRNIPIDALYSSDLRRTVETAGAVLKYHPKLTLTTDERLREVSMGAWEDVPWGNAFYDAPEQMLYFASDPEKWDVPGGEKFSALQTRIKGAVEEFAKAHDGGTIAVVSHGSAIRSLICLAEGVPSERISEIPHGDNTCVAFMNYENGKFTAEFYNDNSHLPEAISTFAGQSWWKAGANDKIDMANLRLVPMDLSADARLYEESYADSWKNAHGDLRGFDASVYLASAKRAAQDEPRSLMKAYIGASDFAGLIELDMGRAREFNAGWISFFYLAPEYRGHSFAPQLLGHAVTLFRALGRTSLRLHVAQDNARAIRFYEREGFKRVGQESGIISTLLLMEMEI